MPQNKSPADERPDMDAGSAGHLPAGAARVEDPDQNSCLFMMAVIRLPFMKMGAS